MLAEEWRKKQEHKSVAQYTHFDRRVSLAACWDYITSAEKVAHHGFFPFIHYTIKNRRIKNGKKANPKERQIYYAAHKDGWIYRYYAYLLNEFYNIRVKQDGINDVAIAYRTDLKKNNVDFAKIAFDFIKETKDCYIMIGDFTDFFDNLNHQYLKEQLCNLLSVDRLPPDYYAVFKNVTRFSYFELHDLLVLNGIKDTLSGRKKFNSPQNELALDMKEFRKIKGEYLQKNPKTFCGVPQGSPISAVLANIYMLSADKQIHTYVTDNNGLYMRYSDDFIIILPTSKNSFEAQFNNIKAIIDQIPDLVLKDEKTKLFYVNGKTVRNCTADFISEAMSNKHLIEFLGFSYDGKSIRIRDKTISKYYNRMYRKVKTIVNQNGYTPKHRRISCKNLYDRYSYKGSRHYKKSLAYMKGIPFVEEEIQGNFFDYVITAQNIFKGEPIDIPQKRHMQKIRKRLKEIEKK